MPQSELFAGKYSTPDDHDLSVGYWTAVTAGHPLHQLAPVDGRQPQLRNSAFYNDPTLEQLHPRRQLRPPTSTTQNADYEKAQDYIAEHALSIGVYDRLSTLAVVAEAEGRLAGARTGRTDVL